MKLNLIVATALNMGIGNKGTIPWRLKCVMYLRGNISSPDNIFKLLIQEGHGHVCQLDQVYTRPIKEECCYCWKENMGIHS